MSIIEPNTNELLSHADNRYTLAVEAAKRSRQIVSGKAPLIDSDQPMKPLKAAVNEINRGLISYDRPILEEERDAE